ncbi:nucleoid-associated protein [Pseudomonas sp. 148P]|uniref:Nucleoid-associated protein n=1 Tax=Pseudomonas ulcerans TaxID=3115852 RepID=A0ABU7HWH8_9PSED|nr:MULTISPECIES: nucleoid-associated protein [unclassified Pseudomonas]MEE1924653.1 nucleoid-associated protein [Pseudomonas sp. 147P]MEE1935833.1 nucleoid-associated protein [Pseudomonas sp. 148P]
MADGSEGAPEASGVTLENEIVNVIVHTLNKGEAGFIVDGRERVLDVGETVQRLIDQLARIYAGKTGKSHGRFEEDTDNYPVSRFLEGYFKNDSSDFVATTLQMAENLRKSAQGTASTGGHAFFAHFRRTVDGTDFFIVAILNDELGAALNKSKEVVDALHLDIKGFRLAGRVNMTDWTDGGDKYLSFIKGRGQDKVSDFFKLFLGCNNSVAAVLETRKLGTALDKFVQSQEMTEEHREEFLRNAYVICKRYAEKDVPFELNAFANEVWPENPEALSGLFEASGLDISDGFIPDKRSLRSLVKFSGGSKNWSITFDRAALSNGEIEFDMESEALIIKQLPKELAARLRTEVNQDGEED